MPPILLLNPALQAFYRYLQAQEPDKQAEGAKEFVEAIERLLKMFERAEKDCPEAVGLWRDGNDLSEQYRQQQCLS